MPDRLRYSLTFVAGLMGAVAVAIAALAAHQADSAALATAATMMLIHAAAAIALLAVSASGCFPARWCSTAGLMLFGAGLFGGDIALNTLVGSHLFPFAAPAGGMLIIVGWLFSAMTALAELRSARR